MPTIEVSAEALLEQLRTAGLPVEGFTIRDRSDEATWTFYGHDVTPAIAAAAVDVIRAAQAG